MREYRFLQRFFSGDPGEILLGIPIGKPDEIPSEIVLEFFSEISSIIRSGISSMILSGISLQGTLAEFLYVSCQNSCWDTLKDSSRFIGILQGISPIIITHYYTSCNMFGNY